MSFLFSGGSSFLRMSVSENGHVNVEPLVIETMDDYLDEGLNDDSNDGLSEHQMVEITTVNQSQTQSDELCAICMMNFSEDPSSQIRQPDCGHRFHENCLFTWLKDHNSCPICRFNLNGVDDDDRDEILSISSVSSASSDEFIDSSRIHEEDAGDNFLTSDESMDFDGDNQTIDESMNTNVEPSFDEFSPNSSQVRRNPFRLARLRNSHSGYFQ